MTAATLEAPRQRVSKGAYVIKWIETHCVYTQGRWIGQKAKLLPWQRSYLLSLFEVDPDTKRRRYRWSLLGLAKKNGKTELAAWLGLYFLIGDGEPSPLVACAAGSDEQADLVFGAAKRCAELSPTLSKITERYDKEILVPSIPGAKLRRLSAAVGTNDGPSWSAIICDELHEWMGAKGENLWNVLTNGTGAREQPMILQITTAGWDKDTICYRQYAYGKRVESGEVDDPAYLFRWVEAPEGSDYRDPATWNAANPSYGVIVGEDFYRDQLTKKTEAIFKRYFCNMWVAASQAWLPHGVFDSCTDAEHKIPDGARVTLGFDGSYSNDSTALVVVSVEEKPHIDVVALWERPAATDDPAWRVDIVDVEKTIRDACRKWNVQEIVCDPARWARTYQVLSDEGLPIVEYPNSAARMVPATQRIYEAFTNQTLSHSGDPRLARHFANAVIKDRGRGQQIFKEHKASPRKIDLAVATVMAYDRAAFYETQGTTDVLETVW